MTSQTNLDKFNEFYKETYSNILRYIIIKCHNINDVNDIIQEVYLELWKIMNKKNIDDTNINSYLIGIAINKIKKYYSLVMRIRDISLFDKNNNDLEIIDKIDSSFDIESLLIKDEEWKSNIEHLNHMARCIESDDLASLNNDFYDFFEDFFQLTSYQIV